MRTKLSRCRSPDSPPEIAGGAIGSQIYQPSDAPLYLRGHYVNGSLLAVALLLFLGVVWALVLEGQFVGENANMTGELAVGPYA